MKNLDQDFSIQNEDMEETSDNCGIMAPAWAEDCPDDLEGILEVLDASSDGSGSLRYIDDFGMADDPDADIAESPGALLSASDRAF